MDLNLEHVLHSAILGVLLYLGMVYLLKQGKKKAMSRSVLIASLALVYMILFGHNFPPTNLNADLGL
tara:strand:- start:408 stop:608 length:201 start_codon:yes stop_codon:yes gene_type:complete